MNTFSQTQAVTMRQCQHCGKFVPSYRKDCPKCRETLPEMPVLRRHHADTGGKIRQGLLYMLLAVVIHYFAGGYSMMSLPYPINPLVTIYLSPLLFLSGLGFVVHQLFLRYRS